MRAPAPGRGAQHFGSKLLEDDGSVAPAMIRDALHPGERGYEIWAEATEPLPKEWLSK